MITESDETESDIELFNDKDRLEKVNNVQTNHVMSNIWSDYKEKEIEEELELKEKNQQMHKEQQENMKLKCNYMNSRNKKLKKSNCHAFHIRTMKPVKRFR